MQKLFSLVYVSSSTREPTIEDINHLLTKAISRNKEQNVTGVLLYNRGTFMQYIEGPQVGMSTVYEAIQKDALHTGIIELLCEPIDCRQFKDWAMAYKAFVEATISESRLCDDILENSLNKSEDEFRAAELLRKFWYSQSFPKESISISHNILKA